jgi:hypothetical protein
VNTLRFQQDVLMLDKCVCVCVCVCEREREREREREDAHGAVCKSRIPPNIASSHLYDVQDEYSNKYFSRELIQS